MTLKLVGDFSHLYCKIGCSPLSRDTGRGDDATILLFLTFTEQNGAGNTDQKSVSLQKRVREQRVNEKCFDN